MSKQLRKKQETAAASSRSSRKVVTDRPVIEPGPAIVIAFFGLATIIFFWQHLAGDAFLWEDIREAFFPYQVYAARNFWDGQIPFWNPFTFNGMPFLADLQNGFFYPAHQLMYLLSGGDLGIWLAQFILILHYFIAMVGMWRLARALGIGQWGAMFAGITYALSAIPVMHMIHHMILYHLCWFPTIVYLFYRGVNERSWLHALLAGITLGCVMLSGAPQITLYIVIFLFCLTIFLLARSYRGDETSDRMKNMLMRAVAAAIPVVIGVGIFAIQLLPAQELADLSVRANFSYEKSLEGAMGPGQLVTLFIPKFFGVAGATGMSQDLPFWYRQEAFYYWETGVYFGVVALILMTLGLASRRLGSLGWFLFGMGVFGLLYGLGDSFFVHPLLSNLPLFGTFRDPVRLAIYLSLGGALLAGAGIDRIIAGDQRDTRAVQIAAIVGGIIVLLALLTLAGVLPAMMDAPQQIADAVASTGVAPLLIAGIATAVVWFCFRRSIPAAAGAGVLVLLATIDLFSFGMGQNAGAENPEEFYRRNDAQFSTFKITPPDSIFRMKMREGGAMLMARNQGPYSRIALYEGYNALNLQRRVPPAPQPKAFDLLNIRFDVQVDSLAGSMGLVERTTRYPHVRMMYDVRVADSAAVFATLQSGEIDLGRTVLLEKNPGITTDGTGNGQARITRYDNSEIEIAVTTDKPGILLASEIWYPAWKVYLDGKPQELLIADYSLRGVAVPAGTHTVTMRYESEKFGTGLWITIATLLISLVGAVVLALKRRRERAPADSVPAAA